MKPVHLEITCVYLKSLARGYTESSADCQSSTTNHLSLPGPSVKHSCGGWLAPGGAELLPPSHPVGTFSSAPDEHLHPTVVSLRVHILLGYNFLFPFHGYCSVRMIKFRAFGDT